MASPSKNLPYNNPSRPLLNSASTYTDTDTYTRTRTPFPSIQINLRGEQPDSHLVPLDDEVPALQRCARLVLR